MKDANSELEKAKRSFATAHSFLCLYAEAGEEIPKKVFDDLQRAASRLKSAGYQPAGYDWIDPLPFKEWWKEVRHMRPPDIPMPEPLQHRFILRPAKTSRCEPCADDFRQHIAIERDGAIHTEDAGKYGFFRVAQGGEECGTKWTRAWTHDWPVLQELDEWKRYGGSKLVADSNLRQYSLVGSFTDRVDVPTRSVFAFSAESVCNHSIMPVYTWTSRQYKATVRVRHALGLRFLIEIGGHLVPHPIHPGTYYHSKLGQALTFWSNEDGYLELDSPLPTCGEGLQGAFELCETRIESSGKWYWSIGALEFVTRVEYEIDLQLGDWYPCVIQGDVGLCWSLTEELRRIIVAESQPPEYQPT